MKKLVVGFLGLVAMAGSAGAVDGSCWEALLLRQALVERARLDHWQVEQESVGILPVSMQASLQSETVSLPPVETPEGRIVKWFRCDFHYALLPGRVELSDVVIRDSGERRID